MTTTRKNHCAAPRDCISLDRTPNPGLAFNLTFNLAFHSSNRSSIMAVDPVR
jgi:hypothetical protein